MTPDLSEGGIIDATKIVNIEVESYGRTIIWQLYAETVASTVSTVSADAWTKVAWVYGSAEAGKDNGVEYRIAGTEEWTRVPKEEISSDGGSFCARILHLSPSTAYEARAYSETEYGDILSFTTGTAPQLPNADFDSWWLDGKVWCPWIEGGEAYWGTGNKGSTTLGTSNTIPTDDTPTGSGRAAMLKTEFKGVGVVGKLAAGSIFAGYYVRTDGTNGVLSFGREFTQRPTKVRGYLKYDCATISHANTTYTNLIGQPDTCIVWCSLIDADKPFEIRTNPKNQHLFDPGADDVVAYGKIEFGQSVPSYIPFEFELDYRSTSRVPRFILLTASASKYGDYFTGGVGSTLCLDDIELIYDY